MFFEQRKGKQVDIEVEKSHTLFLPHPNAPLDLEGTVLYCVRINIVLISLVILVTFKYLDHQIKKLCRTVPHCIIHHHLQPQSLCLLKENFYKKVTLTLTKLVGDKLDPLTKVDVN